MKDLDFNLTNADHINFFGNTNNPFEYVNGALYRASDQTLVSIKLNYGNSTNRYVETVAEKQLDFVLPSGGPNHQSFIKAIKTRGNNKVLVYNPNSDEVLVFSEDLNKQELKLALNTKEELIDILHQPLQSFFFSKHQVGMFRNSGKANQNQPVCKNKFYDVSQIMFDMNSPNLVIAFAKAQQALLVYEFKSQQGKWDCIPRGILRLNEVFTESGLTPEDVMILTNTQQLLFTFENSN